MADQVVEKEEEVQEEPGFELLIDNQEAENATLPIGWCIGAELREKLNDPLIKDKLHVLIVTVTPNRSYEERHLVRLSEATKYIQLHAPGENKVYAFVLKRRAKKESDLYRSLIWTENDKYKTKVFNNEGDVCLNTGDDYTDWEILAQDMMTVTVSSELFAPTIHHFWKWWANLILGEVFGRVIVDQCSFRRRMLFFSGHLQFLIIGIYLLFKIPIAFLTAFGLTLAGRRGVYWKPIIRPFAYSFKSIWGHKFVVSDDRWVFAKPYTWFFSPLVFVATVGLTLFVLWIFVRDFGFWFFLQWFVIIFGGMSLLSLGIAYFFVPLFDRWLDKLFINDLKKWRAKMKKEEEERQKEEWMKELGQLSCQSSAGKRVLEIKLPKHAWFWGKKAEVCRPFPK